MGWLGHYNAFTPGVRAGTNATVRLGPKNEPQPDAILLLDPKSGGQTRIGDEGFVEGAPELVAEVSSSTVSFDLHTKKSVYLRHGVKEYVVWRVLDEEIDWFASSGSDFEPFSIDAAGILRSRVFPGFWLDAAALIRGDLAAVFSVLQQGLASPEHAEFVRKK